jgi:homoserine dehydrogenase
MILLSVFENGAAMRLVLIGFGTVGQGLAQILHDKAEDLNN